MAKCSMCGGDTTVTCPKCDGTGQLPDGPDGGSYKTCFHCGGKTEVTCPRCNGSGEE
jgi:hypothetical protein